MRKLFQTQSINFLQQSFGEFWFRLLAITVCSVISLGSPQGLHAQDLSPAPTSVAFIESAKYSGRVEGTQIVSGTARWQVRRHGSSPAALEWAGVGAAFHNLRWPNGPASWGTTGDGRIPVIVPQASAELSAEWSSQGETLGERLAWDLTFPAALDSRIALQVPHQFTLVATAGLVHAGEIDAAAGTRVWTVELGQRSRCWIQLIPEKSVGVSPLLPCETTTVYSARFDGLVIQQDFQWTVTPNTPQELSLTIPAGYDLRNLAVNETLLTWNIDEAHPGSVQLKIPRFPVGSRVTLRARCLTRIPLSLESELLRAELRNSLETGRIVVLRVEAPLQLREYSAPGFLQTGLTTGVAGTDELRFEAREREARLRVRLEEPAAVLRADVHCLLDRRPGGNWAAVTVRLSGDSGRSFHTRIELPPGWELVTAQGGNEESRVASAGVQGRELDITWSSPLSSEGKRLLRLFFSIEALPREEPFDLRLPVIQEAPSPDLECQFILPPDLELRLLNAEGWRVADEVEIAPEMREFTEVAKRLPAAIEMVVASLQSLPGKPSRTARLALAGRPLPLDLQPPGRQERSRVQTDPRQTPQAVDLRLISSCGPFTDGPSSHVARLSFIRPMRVEELELRLPVDAHLSTVMLDGIPAQIVRTQSGLILPAETPPFQALEISYSIAPHSEWWTAEYVVPVPQTNFPQVSFEWNINVRGGQQLAAVQLPGIATGEVPVETIASCLFGPLTRSGTEKLFQPWSALEWTTLFSPDNIPVESFQPRRVFSEIYPVSGSEVVLRTWNRRRALQWSWIAFWGASLATVWLRRAGRTRSGRGLLLTLSLMGLSLVWIPATATPIAGGAFIGAFLTILVPRPWIRQNSIWPQVGWSLPSSHTISTVGASLLLGLGWIEAQEPPRVTPSGEQAFHAPATMIRQAEYNLVEVSPSLRVRARYNVLTRQEAPPRWVPLPLRNVVVRGATAQVDGHPESLAPTMDGEGILVSLPMASSEAQPPTAAGYHTHRVELEFDLPPWEKLAATGDPAHWPAIPEVLDSHITRSAEWGHVNFAARGANQATSSQTITALGGVSRLQPADVLPAQTIQRNLRAVSRLELHPLNVRVQTWITGGPEGLPEELRLRLPPGSRPLSASGPAVVDDAVLGDPALGAEWILSLRDSQSPEPVELRWDFPPQFESGRLLLPELNFWSSPAFRHILALQTPPAVTLTIDDGGRTRPATLSEWQPAAELIRGRPSLAISLDSPRAIPLIWRTQEPARTAFLAETLSIGRNTLQWSAVVELTVSRSQAFQHRFIVDPGVRLNAILAGDPQEFQESLRYFREGDLVTVLIPGGQLGPRTIEIRGEMLLPVDSWISTPQFALLDGVTTASTLDVLNLADWSLEADFEGNSPADPGMGFAFRQLEPRAHFPHGAARPWSLRASLPPSAIRADQVTSLQPGSTGDWEFSTQIRLSTSDALLHQTVLRIPHTLRDVRLLNTDVQSELIPGGDGDELRIRIPDRLAAAVTLSLTGEFSMADGNGSERAPRGATLFPLVTATAAQAGSQFLLLPDESPMVPDPAVCLRVSGASFPNWAEETSRRGVREGILASYQLMQSRESVPIRRRAASLDSPLIPLEETSIWTLPEGGLAGVTRIWIEQLPSASLEVMHDPSTSLLFAQLDEQGSVLLEKTGQGTRVQLPPRAGASSLHLYWTNRETSKVWKLFRYSGVTAEQRLCAVSGDPSLVPEIGPEARLGVFNAWLLRWQSLLECVRDSSATATIDETVLAAIRQSRNTSSSLLNASLGPTPPQQEGLYQKLTDRWAAMQEELYLPPSPTRDSLFPSTGAFTLLLDKAERDGDVQLLVLNSMRTELAFRSGPGNTLFTWSRIAWTLLIAGVCLAGCWFPEALGRLRESMAANDLDSLLVLEAVWWALLAGSGFAFLALFVTIAYIVVHRLGERWFGAPPVGNSPTPEPVAS